MTATCFVVLFTARKVHNKMSDYESEEENIDFSTQPRGYLYEPEYTDAELHQMEIDRAERERVDREVEVEDGATAGAARPRVADKSWCTCLNCDIMQTEVECYCCHEWVSTANNELEKLTRAARCQNVLIRIERK